MASSPACILIVEDHCDTRTLLSLLLRSAGYRVVEAINYSEALSLAQETDFDLCHLDHKLSDGYGLDLREKLREFNPVAPALFCTGTAYTPDQIEELRCNGDDYLLKPAFPEPLTNVVTNLLKK
jgi:DNA-binding response OmpR family regulator